MTEPAQPAGMTRSRIPGSVRIAVITRDGRECYRCGRPVVIRSRRRGRAVHPGNLLTLDHVRPVSQGGEATVDNLRVCCRACNMAKGGC